MSLELIVLNLGIKAVDMYFATESSIENMRLTATDWELLESIKCVLEVCLLNTLLARPTNLITIATIRLHTLFCKPCRLSQCQSCAV